MFQTEETPGRYPENWTLPVQSEQIAATESAVTTSPGEDTGTSPFLPIIGRSPGLRQAIRIAAHIVRKNWQAVLIHGESGTGKELLARAIHTYSYAGYRPFVEVHCTSLDLSTLNRLLNAETERNGAESGEQNGASGGNSGEKTLFLDEIGDLSEAVQLRLLQFLKKQRTVFCGKNSENGQLRIISTTSQNPEMMVATGQLRPELYYFLSPVSLYLPPLRERGEDIALLANHFLQQFSVESDSPVHRFTPDALARLQSHPWPGNVRQLRRLVERLVLLGDIPLITADQVAEALREESVVFSVPSQRSGMYIHVPPEGLSLAEGEKLLIQAVLTISNWNKRRSSQILKISRPRLDRKIKKYGLTPPRTRR